MKEHIIYLDERNVHIYKANKQRINNMSRQELKDRLMQYVVRCAYAVSVLQNHQQIRVQKEEEGQDVL